MKEASTFADKIDESKSELKEKMSMLSVLREIFKKKDAKGIQKKNTFGSFFDSRDERFKR